MPVERSRGRRIRVLATGGTIATTAESGGPSAPRLDGAAVMRSVTVPAGLDAEIETRDLTRTPSWRLSLADMEQIAVAATEAANDPEVHGVVVTHGTTTLEYTAFLTDLYCDSATPIVFTGAMRRADAPDADGPRNVQEALTVAASEAARGLGTVVCMGGDVVAARDAWKLDRTEPGPFLPLRGRVGRVGDDSVVIERRVRQHSPALSGPLEPRVAVVKTYPGSGSECLAAAVAAGARGLVLEGLPGVGGIPPGMHDWLLDATDLPIVVTSRAPRGSLPQRVTGGTGEPLEPLDLISGGALTSEQALLLLAVALGQSDIRTDVQAIFARYGIEKEDDDG